MEENSLFKKLSAHQVAFWMFFGIVVFLVGSVYAVIPHGIRSSLLSDKGGRYIPITIASHFDHMNVQAARYREILDGHVLSGEVDTYEHEGGPMLWPALSAAILTPILFATRSVFATFIISDFLFPILLFSAFFVVIQLVTKNRWYALCASFALMLFPQLPTLIPPSSFLELKILAQQIFGIFTQTSVASIKNYLVRESFIPGGPFFVLSFYFAYRAAYDGNAKRIWVFLGGVFYGLLFYLYFYFWVFASIFLGVFFCLLLVWRQFRSAASIIWVILLGLFFSIPFWINQFSLMALPQHTELLERMGLEYGHGVRWFLWKTYLLFFVFSGASLWIGIRNRMPILGSFLSALALSGIVAYNANIVTGFMPQSDHWGNKVFLPTNGIIITTLAYYVTKNLISRYEWLRRAYYQRQFFIGSITALFFVSLVSSVVYAEITNESRRIDDFTVSPNLLEAYKWLNENTEEGSVVMSPALETNLELAVYSHNKIFLARAQNTRAAEDELLNRFYFTYQSLHISTEKFYQTIISPDGVVYFFSLRYESKMLDTYLHPEQYTHLKLPQGVLERALNEFIFYRIPATAPYRLYYIFICPRERALNVEEDALTTYQKVHEKDGVTIYKVDTN